MTETAGTITNEGLVKLLKAADPKQAKAIDENGVADVVGYCVECGPVKHAAPFTGAEADAIVAWWLAPADETIALDYESEVPVVLANLLGFVKDWAIPTMSYVKLETSRMPVGAKALGGKVLTAAAQDAWKDLEVAVKSITAALPKRATSADGEPLWLHMPEDGAWVATAIAPAEGAEGYRPLYV